MSTKMRWVEITDADEIESMRGDIGAPMIYFRDGHYWVLADEMRFWRASQNTSGVPHG